MRIADYRRLLGLYGVQIELVVFERRGGTVRKAAVEEGGRGLADAAPVDLPGHRRKIYAGGIIVLHCLCKHFRVTSVKLESASVKNGVLALLQILHPTPLSAGTTVST